MPGFLGQLGMQAAGNTLGAGMGLLLQRGQDRRQYNMQRKLQRMEMEGSKEMTDYNFKKQLEMWEATNYKAQMNQLKMAGLNPGLIYGMSGGGGATTNIQQGSAPTGQAPKGGGEAVAMGMQMGQAALTAAQIKNLEAQTNLTNAQADKTAGVDTQEATARIGGIQQSIKESQERIEQIKQAVKTAKAQEELTKLESGLKELQTKYDTATMQDRIQLLKTTTEQAAQTLRIITTDADINDATKQEQIKQVEATLFKTYAETRLLQAAKNLTVQELQTEKAKLTQIAAQIAQGHRRLDIDKMNAETNRQRQYDEQTQATDPIGDILDKVGFLLPIPGGKTHKPIEGFRRKN